MESNTDRFANFEDSMQIYSIFKTLHAQRDSSKLCDVILRISGDQIYAHSNVLAAASPYFDSLFSGVQDLPRAFSQKTPQIIEIHIDGDGDVGYGEAVRKVVDFMYTSCIRLSFGVLTQVIEIARIMQMDNILEFCDAFQEGRLGDRSNPRSVLKQDANVQTVSENNNTEGPIYLSLAGKKKDGSWIYPQYTHFKRNKMITSTPNKEPGRDINRVGFKRKRGRPCKEKPQEPAPQVSPTADKDPEDIEVKKENENPKPKRTKKHEIQTKTVRKLQGVSKRGRPIYANRFRESQDWHKPEDVVESDEDDANDVVENDTTEGKPDDAADEKESTERLLITYDCDLCSHVSTSLAHFQKHRLAHDLAKKYICDQCDFSTHKFRELKLHRRDHLHSEYKCSYCGWVCPGSDNQVAEFQEHLSQHVGEEPYFCTVCDLKFKTKTKLFLHLPKHSQEKPYICHICDAGFKWKHALKNHMVVHKITKDHLCDVCGFSTSHKSQLKSHRLIHTGETFKCPHNGCDFQAVKKMNLKFHMLTHTHEKPHQCEVCGTSFSLIKNMKRHMLLHNNTRPYKCDRCMFSTTRFDKLKEHYFKQHNVGTRPGKKFRLTDYLEIKDSLGGDNEGEGALEGEMEIMELQVAEDDGQADGRTHFITHVESATGETIPIAITSVDGELQYTVPHYATQETVAVEANQAQ